MNTHEMQALGALLAWLEPIRATSVVAASEEKRDRDTRLYHAALKYRNSLSPDRRRELES